MDIAEIRDNWETLDKHQRREAKKALDRAAGAILREMRLSAGLTQTDLGRLMDVSFQQVQKYEKGINRISYSRLVWACLVLGIEWKAFDFGTLMIPDRHLSIRAVRLGRAFDRLPKEKRDRKYIACSEILDYDPDT